MDLRELRERPALDSRLGNVSDTAVTCRVEAVARGPRETCRQHRGVDTVALHSSTNRWRLAATRTMITAEQFDLDVAMTASDDERKRTEQSYLRYAGTGIEFCASVAVLTLLGVWLDGRFGTSPLLTIVLAVLGFTAATWNLVRSVFPTGEPAHKDDEQP